MTTDIDILDCVEAVLSPDRANHTMHVTAPLLDDGTIDAEGLVSAVIQPTIRVVVRLAANLAHERGVDVVDILQQMKTDTTFDDLTDYEP